MSVATMDSSPSSSTARSPGKSMQVDGKAQALFERAQVRLPHDAGDHAGQDIAAARGGHPGVSGRIDGGRAIRTGNDRPKSL